MNGLEHHWRNRAQFFHCDIRSPLGKELACQWKIEHLPALLLFDPTGQLRWRLGMGPRLHSEVESRFQALLGESSQK